MYETNVKATNVKATHAPLDLHNVWPQSATLFDVEKALVRQRLDRTACRRCTRSGRRIVWPMGGSVRSNISLAS